MINVDFIAIHSQVYVWVAMKKPFRLNSFRGALLEIRRRRIKNVRALLIYVFVKPVKLVNKCKLFCIYLC